VPPACALALLLAPALLLSPAARADALDDDAGDAVDQEIDAIGVAWAVGNATIVLEVRFVPSERTEGRAVRGLVMLGEPGAAEPAEWYQVTIADETHAFAGHAGPSDAAIVGTSWTGDLARVELARQAPAPAAPCAFAVVEAGSLTPEGFVRSDVAPRGFSSPEEAWGETESCPEATTDAVETGGSEEKGSPALPLVGLVAAFVLLALRRRPIH